MWKNTLRLFKDQTYMQNFTVHGVSHFPNLEHFLGDCESCATPEGDQLKNVCKSLVVRYAIDSDTS